ncbi:MULTISPECIES: NAD(P)/FAD-dependent oxidoreductase [unclassified Synechocystis]|uniref:NAD(P)/FAD-dependent oxidoreductase n=1 Tax=unclassified Synechocystis TaxID=2640012 RepID=UPI0004279EED|nr:MULTISPECIES: FAD-dependent oxidoreductase [unclassified Synechocystis]AIE72916.1 Lycopene cyclase, CruP type [Synechocystis sp. PCC 6714]MCT0252603.1 FAD-binding oxidoreductase [Synechocystis sp. CS-94]
MDSATRTNTFLDSKLNSVPGDALGYLRRLDQRWQALCQGKILPIPEVAQKVNGKLGETDFDAVICGGTLGILLAPSLQIKGWRVAVIERGKLQGRVQEWNISRQELQTFVELDLLTPEELETAIASEYNPGRIAFHGGQEFWINNVLNVGVDPVYLLEALKQKFLQAGGILLEYTAFQKTTIHPDGVEISYQQNGADSVDSKITSRLLIDAMGHGSPLVNQARQGKIPDGVCLVVGSCAQVYPDNKTGDLIATTTGITNNCQYFWEAFPARDGRTTYLFTYVDVHPDRIGLEFLFEEYFRLLPSYQKVNLDQLQWQRFLSGFFPAYKSSPLHFPWSRVLAVGDSAGSQSPVSFGGFGAIVRHLQRLTTAIGEALEGNYLTAADLALLQPYQPNIGVTWLFQQTMGVRIGQKADPDQINHLMNTVFAIMDQQGEKVMQPFLQDVIQWSGLTQTLPRVNPLIVLPLLPQIGLPALVDWLGHYANLAGYSLAYPLFKNILFTKPNFEQKRCLEAWYYGSGFDFHRD